MTNACTSPLTSDANISPWGRLLSLAGLIILLAAFRLIPHPPNFTPVGAIALFGGASFSNRKLALLIPWAALFLSDLVLGLHVLVPVVYASFGLNVLLGRWIRHRRTAGKIALATLVGATQFFLVTNFACWLLWFPYTLTGLVSCYVSALPYFGNTLAGDACFTGLIFGAFALLETGFPKLREHSVTSSTSLTTLASQPSN